MLDLTTIKQFIQMPPEYEGEDNLLEHFRSSAYAYLRNAVDNFNISYDADEDFKAQADEYVLYYIADSYQNRDQMMSGSVASRKMLSIVVQLQSYERKV